MSWFHILWAIWLTGFVLTAVWLLCDESTKGQGFINFVCACLWFFLWSVLICCALFDYFSPRRRSPPDYDGPLD